MCLCLSFYFSLQKKWDVILGGSGALFLFVFFVFGLCVCFFFFVFADYSDIGRGVELVGCL